MNSLIGSLAKKLPNQNYTSQQRLVETLISSHYRLNRVYFGFKLCTKKGGQRLKILWRSRLHPPLVYSRFIVYDPMSLIISMRVFMNEITFSVQWSISTQLGPGQSPVWLWGRVGAFPQKNQLKEWFGWVMCEHWKYAHSVICSYWESSVSVDFNGRKKKGCTLNFTVGMPSWGLFFMVKNGIGTEIILKLWGLYETIGKPEKNKDGITQYSCCLLQCSK